MSQRYQKHLLWSCGVLGVLGAAALVALAVVRGPLSVATDSGAPTTDTALWTTDEGRPAKPLEAYAEAWSLQLRRPLYDPPPKEAPAAPPPPPPAPLNVRLVGTILEPGRPLGMFIGPAGKLEMLTVGEMADGAQILRIDLEDATLLHHGREVTLTIARENE